MSARRNESVRYCDFDCPHADFPPPETAGLCRTMAAVWCRKLRELVDKNSPCRCQRGAPSRRPKAARASARGKSRRRPA